MTEQELINAVLEDKFKGVRKLAEDKFGEENVDFQLEYELTDEQMERITSPTSYYRTIHNVCGTPNGVILRMIIHLPKKTVTCNETGMSHDIEDVYCNVTFHMDMKFEIYTARSTYTEAEYNSNYTHSHVNGVSYRSHVWNHTCLGREESPLNRIKARGLHDHLDWIELLNEIDRFYEVESLVGVPYHRLDNISKYNTRYAIEQRYYGTSADLCRYDDDFRDFTYFVMVNVRNNPQMLSNTDGEFQLNITMYNFKLLLTNCIVEYLERFPDERPKFDEILERNIKTNAGLYAPIATRFYMNRNNNYLFHFKGQPVHLTLKNTEDENVALMPNNKFQIYVYLKLLIMLNYERFRGSSTETVKIVL